MMQPNPDEVQELPFISHLIELRDRLLRTVICVLLVFLLLSYYANDIYAMLAGPLMKHLPQQSSMIAIEVASPFFTPFKLALVVAIFISIPYLLYQFWAFIEVSIVVNPDDTALVADRTPGFYVYEAYRRSVKWLARPIFLRKGRARAPAIAH